MPAAVPTKDYYTDAQMALALSQYLGNVGFWDKIFLAHGGTQSTYISAIRDADPKNFLYFAHKELNSNVLLYNTANSLTNQRFYGELSRTTWRQAIKQEFGGAFFNEMIGAYRTQYGGTHWQYELQEQYLYGSSRLGSVQRNLPLVKQVVNTTTIAYFSYQSDSIKYNLRGQKRYELSNHTSIKLSTTLRW